MHDFWELRPNDARGVSHVKKLIPNQIELNKNIARIAMASKSFCFPHLAYLEGAITNEEQLDVVGGKIAVQGTDVNEINKMLTYVQPAQISNIPKQLQDDLLQVTQELSGSGENTLGQIELNRVAASAINAVNERAESMLDDQVAMMAQFGEDFASLMAELHMVYEPDGFSVEQPVIGVDGQPVLDDMGNQVMKKVFVTQEIMDNLMPAVRVDITKENSFNVLARDKWLDDLLSNNLIDLKTRVRMASTGSPIPKNEMLAEISRMEAEQQQKMMQQQQAQDADPSIGQVPPEAPMA